MRGQHERRNAADPRGRGWTLLVPVILTLAGLLFATSAGTARGTDLRGDDRGDLAELIQREQRTLERAAESAAALRAEVQALGDTAAEGNAVVAAAVEQAAAAEAAAHLQPLQGRGVQVVLTDAEPTGSLPTDIEYDDLVVHQQDLQGVVNALWAGGAEGMQIMDQRVVSTSAVRCVGNVLLLQDVPYPPPYTIRAVGDVTGMLDALDASPAVQAYRYYVDLVGLGYDVSVLQDATLPAYGGSIELRHARPLRSGER